MNKFAYFVWLTTLLATLAFYPIATTVAGGQTPEVVSVCVEGYEDELYMPSDFVAFAGSTIIFNVKSQSALTATNYDGADITTTKLGDEDYVVRVHSSETLKTQVIFQNNYGYSFKNITFLENAVSDIEIFAPTMVAKSQTNAFEITYNKEQKLKYSGLVEFKLTLADGQKLPLDSGSPYVVSITNNRVELDFSSLSDFSGKFVLSVDAGEVSSSHEFYITDPALSSTFALSSDNVNFITGAKEVMLNAKIDAGSYAHFIVNDNFIRLKSAELLNTADGLDEYVLTLDISNINDTNNIIFSCPTTQGEILRGVNLSEITSVTDFKISSQKDKFSPKEKIVLTALINGDESLSAEIKWYVNDVLVHVGSQAIITRKEGGVFSVYAKIGETQSNVLTLNISYTSTELIIWYAVFIFALLILIGLIVFRKKKKDFFMSSILTDRARKIVPRFNTQLNNYNKRQFKDLIYDTANLRDDTYQNFSETKNLDFERAGRELTSVIKALREIYKAPKDNRLEFFVKYTQPVEDGVQNAIEAFEHFTSTHPNEKMFAFSLKRKKKNKNKSSANANTALVDNSEVVPQNQTTITNNFENDVNASDINNGEVITNNKVDQSNDFIANNDNSLANNEGVMLNDDTTFADNDEVITNKDTLVKNNSQDNTTN